MIIFICSYRGAIAKYALPVAVFLPGHLVLTFASGICLGSLVHEFNEQIPSTAKPVVVLMVLLLLLACVSLYTGSVLLSKDCHCHGG